MNCKFGATTTTSTSCLVNQQSAMGVRLLCVAVVAVGRRMTATKRHICNIELLLN
jgi:hypothetical protein